MDYAMIASASYLWNFLKIIKIVKNLTVVPKFLCIFYQYVLINGFELMCHFKLLSNNWLSFLCPIRSPGPQK